MRTATSFLTTLFVLGCSSSPQVSVVAEAAGTNCPNGGVKISSGGAAQYACDGTVGPMGAIGSGSPDTPAQVLAKLLTVDGPGSMLDADTVDGHHSGEFVYSADNGLLLTSNAFSVDTSVVQARVTGACTGNTTVQTIARDGTVTCVSSSPFQHTVIVAGAAGAATANGTLLRTTIAGITTATTDAHVLVKIEPGTYDLGANQIVVPPFVDIEGSGELSTLITTSGPGAAISITGTSPMELRSLTVTSTYVGAQTAAIYAGVGTNATTDGLRKFTHVTAVASGGTALNQAIAGGPPPLTLVDCTVTATGPGASALFTNTNAHVEIYGSRLTATQPVVCQSGVVLVASSMLGGGAVLTPSPVTCVSSFNDTFTALSATCQ